MHLLLWRTGGDSTTPGAGLLRLSLGGYTKTAEVADLPRARDRLEATLPRLSHTSFSARIWLRHRSSPEDAPRSERRGYDLWLQALPRTEPGQPPRCRVTLTSYAGRQQEWSVDGECEVADLREAFEVAAARLSDNWAEARTIDLTAHEARETDGRKS